MKTAITELEIILDIMQNNREVADRDHEEEVSAKYSGEITSIEQALLVLRAVEAANQIA